MATVHLLSAAPDDRASSPHGHDELDKLHELARLDRFAEHRVVDDPAEADLVLFVESSDEAGPYFERVRRHPVHRAWRDKSYLFSSYDRVVPFLPGVYASIERRWHRPSWTRSGMYLGIREDDDLSYTPPSDTPTYLYSFVGSSATHPVRRKLVHVTAPDARVIDTAAEANTSPQARYGTPENRARYRDAIAGSAFVVCPRGGGSSSFRLFEAMMLGRPPVIVSDQWVPPTGPAWGTFSIRIAESRVTDLPDVLRSRAGDAAAMGVAARAAWLAWFSEPVAFHRVVEWCLELDRAGATQSIVSRSLPYAQMLRPYHAARWLIRHTGHGRRWRVPRPAELAVARERRRRGGSGPPD